MMMMMMMMHWFQVILFTLHVLWIMLQETQDSSDPCGRVLRSWCDDTIPIFGVTILSLTRLATGKKTLVIGEISSFFQWCCYSHSYFRPLMSKWYYMYLHWLHEHLKLSFGKKKEKKIFIDELIGIFLYI